MDCSAIFYMQKVSMEPILFDLDMKIHVFYKVGPEPIILSRVVWGPYK